MYLDHVTKICSVCHQRKPADREHFVLESRSKDGLGARCRTCFNSYRNSIRRGRPRKGAPPRVRLCKTCKTRPVPNPASGYKRRLCNTCIAKLGRKGTEEVKVYADRLQVALGEAGLVASVAGSIVRHDPHNNLEVEQYLRLRVDIALEDERTVYISDPLSLWDDADDATLRLYASTYARSVRTVVSWRQLTPREVADSQLRDSDEHGWADLLAAAVGHWRRRGRPIKKAPETTVRERPAASGA